MDLCQGFAKALPEARPYRDRRAGRKVALDLPSFPGRESHESICMPDRGYYGKWVPITLIQRVVQPSAQLDQGVLQLRRPLIEKY